MPPSKSFMMLFFHSHCVKSVRIRNYSGLHFQAFGLITERYEVSKRKKIRTRITPNTDTFSAVSTHYSKIYYKTNYSAFTDNTIHQFICKQGRLIIRGIIFIFSFCILLVTQLNGSALGVLKHHYITKRIRELFISNSRFLKVH